MRTLLRRVFSGLPSEKELQGMLYQQKRQTEMLRESSQTYQQVLQNLQLKQYKQALAGLSKVRSNLQQQDMFKDDLKHSLLRTQSTILSNLGFPDKAEQKLRENLQDSRANKHVISTYVSYQDLVHFYLQHDINKAILMTRALLERERDMLPFSYLKQFQFCLGTAYLLDQNFKDAKTRLRKVIAAGPNKRLLSMTYNNLAVASLWDPNSSPDQQASVSEQLQKSLSITLKSNEQEWVTCIQNGDKEAADYLSPQTVKPLQTLAEVEPGKWVDVMTGWMRMREEYRGRGQLHVVRMLALQGKEQQARAIVQSLDQEDVVRQLGEELLGGKPSADPQAAKQLYLMRVQG